MYRVAAFCCALHAAERRGRHDQRLCGDRGARAAPGRVRAGRQCPHRDGPPEPGRARDPGIYDASPPRAWRKSLNSRICSFVFRRRANMFRVAILRPRGNANVRQARRRAPAGQGRSHARRHRCVRLRIRRCRQRSRKRAKTPILWVAYPKLASKLASDLSRDIIHALAPRHGLDTVSQIAIDDDWSALRLKRIG